MNDSNCDKTIKIGKSRNEDVLKYIEKYERFIVKIAHKVVKSCPKLEFEDTKQQIVLQMLIAHKDFDPERKTAMNTFLSRVVINTAHNIVRNYWQVKNKVYCESLSLDAFVNENEDDDFNQQTFLEIISIEDNQFQPVEYVNHHEVDRFIEQAIQCLRPLEQEIFKMYLDGYSVEMIASLTNKSRKSIYNIIAVVRNRLKKYCE